MIFLVLIVSACSSPKPDNFANAKYEFAQFVRMAVHLDDQFIHEAHNYRAENRHLTGDKAQKQKSVLKWLKEIHSKQIQKMNSLEIEDREVNRLRTLFIQNRLDTEKAVENDLDFIKADFYRFKRDSETEDMELVYNHLSPNKEDYNIVFNPSETPKAIRYIMNTWSGIYKRSFIEEFHIRHNETPGASFQDNGFWFQTFAYAKRGMIIDKPYYMNRRDNPNSSVHNKEKVYCMNVEYDHIRELLVRDKEVWERFRSMYWLKKYNNYMGTIKRIGEEYKREYVHRFSDEFKRGLELGELDESVFTKLSWSNIQFITKDPNGFYMKKVATPVKVRKLTKKVEKLEKQNAKLQNDIKIIKGSRSYRLGWFMLTIPRKIKALFKGNK